MGTVVEFRDICQVRVNGKWINVVWNGNAPKLMRKYGATDLRYREGYRTYQEMLACLGGDKPCAP